MKMKQIIWTILTIISTLGYSQEIECKKTSLTEAFDQKPAGNRKDFCTMRNIKIDIVFSGNIQHIVSDRAIKLDNLVNDCGSSKMQVWSRGDTEISVTENGKEYWLQVDKTIENQLLSKYKKGETITIYCQQICEHSYDKATTFVIIKRIETK